MSQITVAYAAIDGYRETRSFDTLEGAQAFAQYWVGPTPDYGTTYAVAPDGVGKVSVEGASIEHLFETRREWDGVGELGAEVGRVKRPCCFCGAESVPEDEFCAYCVREVGSKEERAAEHARWMAENPDPDF
jgi:hypothetical protein